MKTIWDRKATRQAINDRLNYLRGEILAERISWGEIAELQDLKPYIDPSDRLLMQWAAADKEEWISDYNLDELMKLKGIRNLEIPS